MPKMSYSISENHIFLRISLKHLTAYYTLYTVYCALHTVHRALQTVHCKYTPGVQQYLQKPIQGAGLCLILEHVFKFGSFPTRFPAHLDNIFQVSEAFAKFDSSGDDKWDLRFFYFLFILISRLDYREFCVMIHSRKQAKKWKRLNNITKHFFKFAFLSKIYRV